MSHENNKCALRFSNTYIIFDFVLNLTFVRHVEFSFYLIFYIQCTTVEYFTIFSLLTNILFNHEIYPTFMHSFKKCRASQNDCSMKNCYLFVLNIEYEDSIWTLYERNIKVLFTSVKWFFAILLLYTGVIKT